LGIQCEYILSLPGSTASVERTFSGMNDIWTNEKSQLKVETLKAILIVKTNLKMTCLQFYHFLKNQKDMLKQISSSTKYVSENECDVDAIVAKSDGDEESDYKH